MKRDLDLSNLEAKARAAQEEAPGPWRVHRCNYHDDGEACGIACDDGAVFRDGAHDECHHIVSEEAAEHIAAASPDVVLELVARVRALERELERWRHGNTIEGDFVCPNELWAVNAEADLRRLRAENERLARENSVILDGQAALKSDLELATERAERADAFSDLVDAVLDADIMSLPDEVRVARLRLLAMDGESPRRKEQP